jgi:hypothetical protein
LMEVVGPTAKHQTVIGSSTHSGVNE